MTSLSDLTDKYSKMLKIIHELSEEKKITQDQRKFLKSIIQ